MEILFFLLVWVLPALVAWLIIYTAVKLAVRHALNERAPIYDQIKTAVRDASNEMDRPS